MSRRAELVFAALAGALMALAQAPLSLWPGVLIGLALALYLSKTAATPRRAAWIGWTTGTAYFCVSLNWLVEPFLVDAKAHAWMAPFALLAMSGGLALFWALAFWGCARMSRPWSLIAFWPLAELARSYVLTGFPWGLLAYSWLDTPLAQWAAWLGPHGLGTVVLGLVALPVLWRLRTGSAVAVLGFAVMAGVGHYRLSQEMPALDDSKAPIFRLTQPNAPQHQKWDRDYIPVFFQRQLQATSAAPRPDIIVWPETSLPNWLNDADATLATITQAAQGAHVVFGVQRYEREQVFNTLAVLNPQGDVGTIYDKHQLVPFGEFIPFARLLARLGLSTLTDTVGGFTAGDGARLIDLGAGVRALPLICYEAVFPQHMNAPEGRADLLLHITNDAWFGTWSGPYQHLAQARFRAIEQGLPLLRSANTGVTAVIDARGQILDQLELGVSGYLDASLPPALSPTLYARTGDILTLLSLLFLLGATLLPYRTQKD